MRRKLSALILLFFIFLSGCADKDDGKINMPFGGNDYKNMSYQEVAALLEKAGFTNIKCEAMNDLITGWLHKENEIEKISIDGHDVFSEDSRYLPDALILISYHSFPEKENPPESIETENPSPPPESPTVDIGIDIYNNAIGKQAIDIKVELENLGYEVKFKHDVSRMDFTESVLPADSEFYIPFVISKLGECDSKNKRVLLYINTQENIDAEQALKEARNNLDAKLDHTYAWLAVEKYGKKQYIYGFKLHDIASRLAEDVADENTWFLKAYCDVKNEYGTWAKNLTCEAYVSGTTDNPRIKDFKVY